MTCCSTVPNKPYVVDVKHDVYYDLLFNCCFVALNKGLPPKFVHALYCHFKLAFFVVVVFVLFLTVYVFGSSLFQVSFVTASVGVTAE